MCFMSIEGREHSSVCSVSKKYTQEITFPLINECPVYMSSFTLFSVCPFADDTREPLSIAEGYKLLGNFTFIVISQSIDKQFLY